MFPNTTERLPAYAFFRCAPQQAEAAYKMVLGRYPTNAKLARTYARFLENVVNDPWKAAKFFA